MTEISANPFSQRIRGNGFAARLLRSSMFTLGSFGLTQILRFGSNLILTRLLFPEAFGLMALVTVIMVGLNMFSDLGTSPAIMQSKRGDDESFLNTAWTINVIRGVALWLVACALAWPVSVFYHAPDLVTLLPVAGLSLVITGFTPTHGDRANRHLMLGRVSLMDLGTQVTGIVVAVVFAVWYQSVWALVLSGILSALMQVALYNLFLDGARNRFHWDKTAADELIRFGRWIFFSTVAGFLVTQGDRAVLGRYLQTDMLGVYNIGFFLASFPMLMGYAMVRKIMIPVYRERPPGASVENFRKLRKMRGLLTLGLLGMVVVLAFWGFALIELLYDPRYVLAGSVVILVSVAQMPTIIGLTYDQAALAAGNSRDFFWLSMTKAVLTIGCLITGAELAGLYGALVGQLVAGILIFPLTSWVAHRQKAWDPLHDAVFFVAASGLGVAALWLNAEALVALRTAGTTL